MPYFGRRRSSCDDVNALLLAVVRMVALFVRVSQKSQVVLEVVLRGVEIVTFLEFHAVLRSGRHRAASATIATGALSHSQNLSSQREDISMSSDTIVASDFSPRQSFVSSMMWKVMSCQTD